MSLEDRIKGEDLLKKYFNATLGHGGRRLAVAVMSTHTQLHNSPTGEMGTRRYDAVESYDIHLTRDDYERLIDYLGYESSAQPTFAPRLITYEKELAKNRATERTLREAHPAVEMAYQKYRLLLDMISNGKKIDD
jgi:hypothetical protein